MRVFLVRFGGFEAPFFDGLARFHLESGAAAGVDDNRVDGPAIRRNHEMHADPAFLARVDEIGGISRNVLLHRRRSRATVA